jgi:hypothetical protein
MGAMSANISPEQFNLLKYLQQRSGASGGRTALDPKAVIRGLRISNTQFAETSAALAAEGLAGVRNLRPDSKDVPSSKCSAIWLTGKGEEYLKRAQFEPKKAAPSPE